MHIVDAVGLVDRLRVGAVRSHDVDPAVRLVDTCRNRDPISVRAPKRLLVVPWFADSRVPDPSTAKSFTANAPIP